MEKTKKKKINTLIAGLIGIFLIVFVGLRIIYPRNYFDSTKNNMTVVTTIFANENTGYLMVSPQIEHNFYSAKIRMEMSERIDWNQKTDALKGFAVQLYPVGGEISTAEELKKYIYSDEEKFPNGELISTKGAVYIHSRGKWRPFLGPAVFENLKFDWDRVSPLKDDFEGSFEEGERVIFRTAHPDGTILRTKDKNFFIVWEETMLPIKNEKIIKEVWSDYFAVEVEKQTPQKVGECRKDFFSDDLKCEFSKKNRTREMAGNVLIFSLGENVEKVMNSKVTLGSFNILDLENPKITLSTHKNRTIEKYSEEIKK